MNPADPIAPPPKIAQRPADSPDLGPTDPMPDLSGVLEAVPLPVLVVDAAGITLAANSALRRLIGADEDLVGRRARFLSPTSGWQRVWDVAQAGPDGQARRVAFEAIPGERRQLDVRVAASGHDGTLIVTIDDRTAVRLLRQQVTAQARALATARTQLRAARDEMRNAENRMVDLIAELEQATALPLPRVGRPSRPA